MEFSTWRIAWRNLGRRRRRTLLAGGAIALGQLALVAINGLMAGSFRDMLQAITGPFVGHVQVHHPQWRDERATDLFLAARAEAAAQIARLPGVRTVLPRLYAPVLAAFGEKQAEPADAETALVVGVDVAAESRRGGLLEALSPAERPGDRKVVLGQVLANRLGVRPGQLVAIIGQDVDGFPANDLFEVRAILKTNVAQVKKSGIVMALSDAATLLAMPDEAHEIVVVGTDYLRADELAAAVRALPRLAGAEVLTWREAVPLFVRIIEMKDWSDLLFVGIVFLAAAAGISNMATMSAFERTHEFGMLLALGMRPRRVVRMVLEESVIIGLAGVAIGSLLGAGLVLVTGHTGIDYAALGGVSAEDVSFGGVSISYVIYPVFEMRHVVFGLCAVTLTSIVASLWPAMLAARLQPVEAMRT